MGSKTDFHFHSSDLDRPLVVLCVTDDAPQRERLCALLEGDGHQVRTAGGMQEALAVLEREHVTVVLIEAQTPGMDGFAVTGAIKASSPDRIPPVILITEEGAYGRCIDCGGDDFVVKPIDPAVLRARLRAAARAAARHERLERDNEVLRQSYQQLQFDHDLAQRVFNSIMEGKGRPPANVSALLHPTAIANGDVVMWAVKPDGGQHVLLGDFTGHGLGAALGAIAVHDIFDAMTTKGFDLLNIIREINRKLYQKLPRECFLAACLLELPARGSRGRIWNAGLPEALVLDAEGGVRRVGSRFLPLGIVPDADYVGPDSFQFGRGERVYLCSDGVIEATNPAGEPFGQARLEQCLSQTGAAGSGVERLRQALTAFRAGAGQDDDITMVEIICDPPSRSQPASRGAEAPEWSLSLHLDPPALRVFDPVTVLNLIVPLVPELDPRRCELYTVISELYANALEHGVLSLPASMKDSESGFSEYYRLRDERLAAVEAAWVRLQLEIAGRRLVIRVEDSGGGIQVPSPAAAPAGLSGRGLALVRSLCEAVSISEGNSRIEAAMVW